VAVGPAKWSEVALLRGFGRAGPRRAASLRARFRDRLGPKRARKRRDPGRRPVSPACDVSRPTRFRQLAGARSVPALLRRTGAQAPRAGCATGQRHTKRDGSAVTSSITSSRVRAVGSSTGGGVSSGCRCLLGGTLQTSTTGFPDAAVSSCRGFRRHRRQNSCIQPSRSRMVAASRLARVSWSR
jgi:hypothetical protein